MWRSLLTLPGSFGIVNFPKLEGVADAFTKPHLVKRAVIFVSATNALQVQDVYKRQVRTLFRWPGK